MYGKINGEGIEYAPINYETEDGNLILNFNKSEQLMTQYGYKMVIERIPEYNINTERIYEKKYIENEDNIMIIYKVIKIEPTNEQIAIDKLIELEQTTSLLNLRLDKFDSEIKVNRTEVDELNLEVKDLQTQKVNRPEVNKLSSKVKDLQAQQVNYDAILSEEVNK